MRLKRIAIIVGALPVIAGMAWVIKVISIPIALPPPAPQMTHESYAAAVKKCKDAGGRPSNDINRLYQITRVRCRLGDMGYLDLGE